jgi:hypothetical protein
MNHPVCRCGHGYESHYAMNRETREIGCKRCEGCSDYVAELSDAERAEELTLS